MKRFIALFLSIVTFISCMMPSSAFAMEFSDNTGNEQRDLVTIVEEIQETRANISSTNNNSNIEIIENNDKFQIVKFTEGSKENILMYNVSTGQLYADGNEITVQDMPVPENEIEPNKLMSSFDHQYKNVQLEQRIINYTQDALGAIIAWSLGAPGSLAIYIASEYINKAMTTGYGNSKACYAFMFKQLDDSYTFYVQSWSMYWDSGYYYHLETFRQTIYQ